MPINLLRVLPISNIHKTFLGLLQTLRDIFWASLRFSKTVQTKRKHFKTDSRLFQNCLKLSSTFASLLGALGHREVQVS